MPWLIEHERTLHGLLLSLHEYLPDFMLKALLNVKMGVLKDAPMQRMKLYTTILLSPELGVGINAYSTIAKDMARQGCLVIIMEHQDGSGYTYRGGDKEYKYYNKDYVKEKCFAIRKEEITSIINGEWLSGAVNQAFGN